MRTKYAVIAPMLLAAAAFVLLRGADSKGADEDRLWRYRNLGKAFYEHPTTSAEAVTEFKKALDIDPNSVRERLNYGLALVKGGQTKEGIAELERAQKQDPRLPHTWFNLGVVFKKEGRHEDAIRQFKRMSELVPDEPVTHYNLGLLYNMTGNEAEALKQFQTAHRLNPRLVAPTFQLYNTHRLAGREAEAAKALALFQQTKQRQKEADESEDMEWCYYSEIYDPIDPKLAAEDVIARAELKFQDVPLGKADPKSAGMLAMDYNGDGRADLVVWSQAGIRLYRNGAEPVEIPALAALKNVVSAAAGDYDNDGFADLCVLTETGAVLLRNANGKFENASAKLPSGRFEQAVWLDYDHDYDMDLLLFGEKSALLRNEGEAGLNDRTAMFPFVAGKPLSAVGFRVIADSKGFDLAVSYADRPAVLYVDQLTGKFEAKNLDAIPAKARDLQAADIDNDSWVDLAFRTDDGPKLLMNRDGKFQPAPSAAAGPGSILFADLENRAIEDLVTGAAVYRNEGVGKFTGPSKPFGAAVPVALAQADFDLDGRTDVAAVAADGSVHLFRNQTATKNLWLRVGLTGVKNLKLGPDTEVEVKAGARYQKKVYRGFPLLFGMRSYKQADTVRITWPNGMIQNEPKQPTGAAATYKEAPKLSGSCPMVFTWNGSEMQFISDVLGVAPLGASSGDGNYFPVDSDEYLQIPGEALKPVNGRYDVRITEELKEISYIDQVKLIALDHPAGVEVFTNDKFKAPPFPEFRLFGATRRVYPVAAKDDRGRDLLSRVTRRDRAYADGFRHDQAGTAEMHTLTLDFGPQAARDNRAVLILNGWVDWADGSMFLNMSQRGNGGLVFPSVQVKDAAGRWKTVIEDMGIPSGGPKTIAVDMTGKFLSGSREVRMTTNLCLFWDEIFLTEQNAAPAVRMTTMDAASSSLRFRGFSTPVIHPLREQPEAYIYSKWLPATSWNPVPGLYTRFGEAPELVNARDDRMVIMASGDELRMTFDATRLPALPSGWKRDFLLLVDGWSKDGDANTAFAQSVEPLPFHGMTSYPYPSGERYPTGATHEAYRREYLNRPPVQVIRPLATR